MEAESFGLHGGRGKQLGKGGIRWDSLSRESDGAFPVAGPSCRPGEGPRGDGIQITRRKASLADTLQRSDRFNRGKN